MIVVISWNKMAVSDCMAWCGVLAASTICTILLYAIVSGLLIAMICMDALYYHECSNGILNTPLHVCGWGSRLGCIHTVVDV